MGAIGVLSLPLSLIGTCQIDLPPRLTGNLISRYNPAGYSHFQQFAGVGYGNFVARRGFSGVADSETGSQHRKLVLPAIAENAGRSQGYSVDYE